MNILHLTALENGGASDYTMNIHNNMLRWGYNSYVAVAGHRIICPNNETISYNPIKMSLRSRMIRWVHRHISRVSDYCLNRKYAVFNLYEHIDYYYASDLLNNMPVMPDVIFVYWVSGFANSKYIKALQKLTGAIVYFVMVDDAFLTGACHFPWSCKGYISGCRSCVAVTGAWLKFLVRFNFIRKKIYSIENKLLIVPTGMDYIRAKESYLWRNSKIFKLYECVDEHLFYPQNDNKRIKLKFNVPLDKRVVMVGASYLSEIRKGFNVLKDAMSQIERSDFILLVVGQGELDVSYKYTTHIGHLDKSALADAFRMADAFISPVLEDSGPQMVNMALMSGVPVVAFPVGVAKDFVITDKTGYLAEWNSVSSLIFGVNHLLDLPMDEYVLMKKECRSVALKNMSFKNQESFFRNLLK